MNEEKLRDKLREKIKMRRHRRCCKKCGRQCYGHEECGCGKDHEPKKSSRKKGKKKRCHCGDPKCKKGCTKRCSTEVAGRGKALNKHLKRPSKGHLEKIRKVHKKIKRSVLRLPGVTAFDIGYAVQDFEFRNLLALRIHVQAKLPSCELYKKGMPIIADPKYYCDDKGKPCKNKLRKFPIPNVEVECRCICKRYKKGKCKNGKHCRRRIFVDGFPLDVIGASYFPTHEHDGPFYGHGPYHRHDDDVQVFQPSPSIKLSDEALNLTGFDRVEPLMGGLSISNPYGPAGSLGLVVWDSRDGTPCVLGNWHVLAAGPSSRVGTPCVQPAIFDGGNPEDRIAVLKRWIFNRDGDAALAELLPGRSYAPGQILGLWHPIVGSREPKLNLPVRKWGRTTGFSEGFVDGIDLVTSIDYGNGVVRYFENQFHIAPRFPGEEVSARGDSGSVVVWRPDDLCELPETSPEIPCDLEFWGIRQTQRVYFAVGMIFAGDVPGSPSGEFALATPMRRLEKKLGFSITAPVWPSDGLRGQPRIGRDRRSFLTTQSVSRSGIRLEPGRPDRDPRPGGPQPDPEPVGVGGDAKSGGGSGG